ncbi:OsmC family protein [Rhizobium sp. AAP43]|uniref:OsmC family protein n=1 Tax=Rhizobium sp. AAP43 TaxID=1523420 RepID=UPI0006B9DD5C|nr:OsmC family protein [Rhizobium sp. AAP43]KPF43426.1 osmotically inducible protein OsmC [Rhizobium sp. AAP43]
MADLIYRPIGATATLARAGYPAIRSATGGELDIVTGPTQPGFNPLDLLLASLAACMSMSARIAARELGLTDRFDGIAVNVEGEKAADEPSRFGSLTVTMRFEGDLTADEQSAVAHKAETICTVSNSLALRPTLIVTTT